MIRVNLLKDSRDTTATSQFTTTRMSSGVNYSEDTKNVLMKLLLLFVPALGFYAYNEYTTSATLARLKILQVEVTQTKEQLKQLDPVVKELEKFQEEKRRLDSQLEVIKNLSKERLKNVKSLDALQGIIPNRAWLEKLKITENKVELDGYATDDIVISDFMQALDSSIYFTNVVLGSSEESKKEDGTVKKFIIKCNLENL